MKQISTSQNVRGLMARIAIFSALLLPCSIAFAQLGTYNFTGFGTCPNQNPAVNSQPANAVFSNYTNVGSSLNCVPTFDAFQYRHWNTGSIDLSEYNQFSITANPGYVLNLVSLSFTQVANEYQAGTGWVLRSSLDNYSSNISTGTITTLAQTPSVSLPAAFNSLPAVTFRLYVVNAVTGNTYWSNDNVALYGAVVAAPPDPANPVSNSPQCFSPGVTITANGTPPAGVSWYWQSSALGTSIANDASTPETVTTTGTYYIRAQDNSSLVWSNASGSIAVTITPDVGPPSFTLGSASTRCQGAATVTYTANASNNSGLSYALDATSATAGNSINAANGGVTWIAGWSGTSTITVTATGCNGPKSANHTVTTTPTVGTPVFSAGPSSARCQGAGAVSYTATASNNTGLSYLLDFASVSAGNNINSATGVITWSAGWSGTSTVTVNATGCGGPTGAQHTVTTTPAVGTPVFTLGATSSRCIGAGTASYYATSTNNTGLTYTLDVTSLGAGNSIDPSTGDVTYIATWVGNSVITATATGCNGPRSSTHTATTNDVVATPVFNLGATSTRCQGNNFVTYTATAANNTGLTYSLDATSLANGNTINNATGKVTYSGTWSGTSIIAVTATGCSGPTTASHTVTITPTVGVPVFTMGSTSIRCQGAGLVTYDASASTTTGITYTLNAASLAAGNSINSATGDVTYVAGWSGTSTITASAAGCNGPKTANHVVTITPTVGTPIFALGASSSRCIGAGTVTYSATATNNTGITYSLDANTLSLGNTINPATGAVTFTAGWAGTSTVTATATGCNGPSSANHTITTNIVVTTPVFLLGSSSSRCQGAGNVTYTATANNSTGITYTLDATTDAYPGNSINSATGVVTYAAGWSGNSTIVASAAGCSGPLTATHSVTTIATVGTPIFAAGSSSARCQGAGVVTYTATATTNTGITYSIDAASSTGGNTINPATGDVTYAAGWSGTTIITATATGCNGPKSANHTVTVNGTVATPVFTLGASSTRCQGAGTPTYTATAANSTGLSYSLDATSLGSGNSINAGNGKVTFLAGWSGISVVTVTATGCSGPTTATHTITITPTVGTPLFSAGATSTRCQGANTVNYGATSTNSTSITYSLNAAAITGGNIINSSTGDVSYAAGWTGSTIITASAAGCNGPATATHTVTITPTVGTPNFTLGATSTRCINAGTVTYTATATNNTGIVYSLDGASLAGGNSINPATGAVTWSGTWSGTSVITATASGCNGPSVASHTVTINAAVTVPVFLIGATSTRCQGFNAVTYTATASNTTGITYTLDASSVTGGNVINAGTGQVSYASNWSGTSVITASAAGCSGPKTATHTVTITPTVGVPVFGLGATSTRCQGGNIVNYSATSTNNTGITYSLDAASVSGGNGINAANGDLSYVGTWTGTSVITATATGCNGPKTANHTVTITPTVGPTSFTLGASSTRCQGAGIVTYSASSTTNTGIIYTLDATSVGGGNSINAGTGAVTFAGAWSGTSIVTATSSGCNGPTWANHTVTITPTVGTPLFAMGASSTRCQGSATITYSATSTNYITLSYNLDGASLAAGNNINTSTGTVIFVASWSGVSTITATATGCNGPVIATHVVTVTPTVGVPVFTMGMESVRTQGVDVITYTATASNSNTITYTLDAASLSGGNTINSATGAVTYTAGWNGTSMITATATGCNGPTIANHIVTINASVAQTPLYLSDPGQTLDRIDPVATGIAGGGIQTPDIQNGQSITFTQTPALCNDLVIKAQTISVLLYLTGNNGMVANPAITASINYGSNNIITLSNPIYNSGTSIITWTGVVSSDITVPAGSAISLTITNSQSVKFKIVYHSASRPSRISLLPVSTFIDITSFNIYNAPYPGGQIRTNGANFTTYYARATATTPFGYKDITGSSLNIIPPSPGTTVQMVCVDSSSCTRTYEYAWTTPGGVGNYFLMATAKEGYENNIKNSELLPFGICTFCPPVVANDSARGDGGAPLVIDVLANDYDPNNNIKVSSLAITGQPNNGSAYITNGRVVYLPNGTYAGKDTITYQICDSTALCSTGKVFIVINPLIVDPCSEATKSHVYYLPFPENEARMALDSSTNSGFPSNNIRTVISLKMPYPNMVIVWDHWEDGYEANPLNPMSSTTQVWGDGNPYNGIAPGYSNDIIPAGGSIVLDNIVPTNPRLASNILYDGRDKIYSSGQITVTQVSGEPSIMSVQCMKTNVSSTADFGTSFTIPAGQNFPSRDFLYSALFIRASADNTTINIDKDNNGVFDTSVVLNEGQNYLVNGGVMNGAVITSSAPIGIDLHFGGNDGYSSRDVPIFPATWYNNIYYTPVPTTGRAANPADSNVVMLYNSLNRPISVNYTSGMPSSGTINLPPKTVVRFPLPMSQTAGYRFENPAGEAFTAIEICDSYTPGGGGNGGTEFDWAFNLIAEQRLTDMATVAWAPGSIDGSRNDNPIWVTPTGNTTIYVKYDGNIGGNTGLVSPCGFRYDVSYPLTALNHKRLLDASDKDQSGLAVYTCDGTRIAAVYGEDASTATTGNPSWDVGSTLQPFCKAKLIFANDDYARTMVNSPVTITILVNDFGFLAIVDPSTVATLGLLQPKHGTVTVNPNGTVIYTPNTGYIGKDTFEYRVCSTPSPVVCDNATVYVDISSCPSPFNENVIAGAVFNDKNKDGLNNDGSSAVANAKVYLYVDANCNGVTDPNELRDSVITSAAGTYQFISYPERFVKDDFDGPGGTNSCSTGSDGTASWLTNWVDQGDPSVGYCNNTQPANKTHADIFKDGAFSYALRLKNKNVSATRTVNLTGASYAFLSFSYRRKSATFVAGRNVTVQASSDGSTFATIYTIAGDGTTDANYVPVYNQDITAYASASTYIRFLTSGNMQDQDSVYIDDVKVQYLKYPQCYITKYDSSSIPANYHTTTTLTHNMTALNSITCLSPYDFGITKNTISVSGMMYDDANGLTDNLINGTATGSVSGAGMFAYLSDTSGRVAYKASLAPGGGYTFPAVDVNSSLSLQLSLQDLPVGALAPSYPDLVGAWVPTGDSYGLNNMAGTGIRPTTPSCNIPVNTALVNITNVNFGIERAPDTDDKSVSYPTNSPGLKYVCGGASGNDPEEGVMGSGKTYKITSLPLFAVLYYNNVPVTLNQVITSFNPALLMIDPDDNTVMATYTYAAVDAANVVDPSPATVTITWGAVLPVTLLDFSGKLNGSKVDLNWKTSSENGSDHFDVERSTDALLFSFMTKVKAKGYSSISSVYAAADLAPARGMNYYRLKMVDKDGKYVYSKIISIQVNKDDQMYARIIPNPFSDKIQVQMTLTHNGDVTAEFIDMYGRMVLTRKVKGVKGLNLLDFGGLDILPPAAYMIKLITDDMNVSRKVVKE